MDGGGGGAKHPALAGCRMQPDWAWRVGSLPPPDGPAQACGRAGRGRSAGLSVCTLARSLQPRARRGRSRRRGRGTRRNTRAGLGQGALTLVQERVCARAVAGGAWTELFRAVDSVPPQRGAPFWCASHHDSGWPRSGRNHDVLDVNPIAPLLVQCINYVQCAGTPPSRSRAFGEPRRGRRSGASASTRQCGAQVSWLHACACLRVRMCACHGARPYPFLLALSVGREKVLALGAVVLVLVQALVAGVRLGRAEPVIVHALASTRLLLLLLLLLLCWVQLRLPLRRRCRCRCRCVRHCVACRRRRVIANGRERTWGTEGRGVGTQRLRRRGGGPGSRDDPWA